MIVFSLFLLFILLFLVYLFFMCVSFVSLPGDDVLGWLFSCSFPSVCFPCFFSLNSYVSGLVWFGLVPSIL